MSSDNDDSLNPENLKPTLKDVVYTAGKAGLGSIPVVGSLFSEIFGFSVEKPLEKRKTKFLIALKEDVEKLKNNQINIQELATNDEFIDVVFQAYELSIRNSQKEKLKALRNAILNTALGKIDVKRDEKMMFLSIINDLTPTHLRVLNSWYNSDEAVNNIVNDAQKNVRQPRLPDDFAYFLKLDIKFYHILLKQLDAWNLLQHTDNAAYFGTPHNEAVAKGIVNNICSAIEERRTSFGRRFLRFISEPVF